jgi:hypothetical protein
LVEGIDAPDHTLPEHFVLIKRNELTQSGRIEALEKNNRVRRLPG